MTGHILERMGVDQKFFQIRACSNDAFRGARRVLSQQEKDEWDAPFRGRRIDDDGKLSIGNVVKYDDSQNPKGKRKNSKTTSGDSEAAFGWVTAVGVVGEDVGRAGKRRKVERGGDAAEEKRKGGVVIRIERLGLVRSILGSAARANDLYRTGQQVNIPTAAITHVLLPSSYRLRLSHDEETMAWTQAAGTVDLTAASNSGAADQFRQSRNTGTWLHAGMEIHVYDCLKLSRVADGKAVLAQVSKFELSKAVLTVKLRELVAAGPDAASNDAWATAFPSLRRVTPSRELIFNAEEYKIVDKIRVLCAGVAVGQRRPHRQATYVFAAIKVPTCERCEGEAQRQDEAVAASTASPLRAMCLFAGAGGEVAGFKMDGRVRAVCAVDSDALCGLTTKTIDGNTACVRADIVDLLTAILDNDALPPNLPLPAAIDAVTASPPCQGFSRARYTGRGTDPRNLLVAVALAMVEVYLPRFFVLENVPGMLDPGMKLGHEEQGAMKLVLLVLIELGYAVRMIVVESAAYGTASYRQRVLFLASRDGRPLPRMPPPTHRHGRKVQSKVMVHPRRGVVLSYRTDDEDGDPTQLVRATTIGDAISDLPSWDWADPHRLYGFNAYSDLDRVKRKRRDEDGIAAYDVCHVSAGGDETSWQRRQIGPCRVAYRSEARNAYQRLMRGGGGGVDSKGKLARDGQPREDKTTSKQIHSPAAFPSRSVLQHQTTRPSVEIAERITNIPFHAGASADDLPRSKPLLWDGEVKKAVSLAASSSNNAGDDAAAAAPRLHRPFERMSADAPARTIMTVMTASGQLGAWVHPTDARLLSVREVARAQGFADEVVFGGQGLATDGSAAGMTPAEAYKQIGNAVPPLVARAVAVAFAESEAEWAARKRTA